MRMEQSINDKRNNKQKRLKKPLSKKHCNEIRRELYHSDGSGYYILSNYLNEKFTEHIVSFWAEYVKEQSFKPKGQIYYGCPNYRTSNSNGVSYYNFFWNSPVDEATQEVSFHIQQLRNQVMGRPTYFELQPINGRSVSYRVVNTKQGSPVSPHRDWIGDLFDYSRLQATLFLSEHGRDYSGNGLLFTLNNGTEISISQDLDIGRGDLLLWRYNNRHSVENVETNTNQIGFLRIIFPPEQTPPEKPIVSRLTSRVKYVASRSDILRKLYNKVK